MIFSVRVVQRAWYQVFKDHLCVECTKPAQHYVEYSVPRHLQTSSTNAVSAT